MTPTETLNDSNFGNYMLDGLREIALPEPPSYQPQTVGWVILGGIILFALVSLIVYRYRIWRQNRYRRTALQRLQELEQLSQQQNTKIDALRELPELLKRTALAVYSREQVARLHGDNWLTFLDSTYEGDEFVNNNGYLLSQLPYQPPEAIEKIPDLAVSKLISVTRNWIAGHQVRT